MRSKPVVARCELQLDTKQFDAALKRARSELDAMEARIREFERRLSNACRKRKKK